MKVEEKGLIVLVWKTHDWRKRIRVTEDILFDYFVGVCEIGFVCSCSCGCGFEDWNLC